MRYISHNLWHDAQATREWNGQVSIVQRTEGYIKIVVDISNFVIDLQRSFYPTGNILASLYTYYVTAVYIDLEAYVLPKL